MPYTKRTLRRILFGTKPKASEPSLKFGVQMLESQPSLASSLDAKTLVQANSAGEDFCSYQKTNNPNAKSSPEKRRSRLRKQSQSHPLGEVGAHVRENRKQLPEIVEQKLASESTTVWKKAWTRVSGSKTGSRPQAGAKVGSQPPRQIEMCVSDSGSTVLVSTASESRFYDELNNRTAERRMKQQRMSFFADLAILEEALSFMGLGHYPPVGPTTATSWNTLSTTSSDTQLEREKPGPFSRSGSASTPPSLDPIEEEQDCARDNRLAVPAQDKHRNSSGASSSTTAHGSIRSDDSLPAYRPPNHYRSESIDSLPSFLDEVSRRLQSQALAQLAEDVSEPDEVEEVPRSWQIVASVSSLAIQYGITEMKSSDFQTLFTISAVFTVLIMFWIAASVWWYYFRHK